MLRGGEGVASFLQQGSKHLHEDGLGFEFAKRNWRQGHPSRIPTGDQPFLPQEDIAEGTFGGCVCIDSTGGQDFKTTSSGVGPSGPRGAVSDSVREFFDGEKPLGRQGHTLPPLQGGGVRPPFDLAKEHRPQSQAKECGCKGLTHDHGTASTKVEQWTLLCLSGRSRLRP